MIPAKAEGGEGGGRKERKKGGREGGREKRKRYM